MKIKVYTFGVLCIFLGLSACGDDSSVNDPDPKEPTPEELGLDANLFGKWVIDPVPVSLAVGPKEDELTWWAISNEEIELLDCLYDDLYIFNEDGTFENVQGTETWLENWQGVEEDGCGSPIAPHDGSSPAEWTANDGFITIKGEGAYLGMAKVHNTGEDGSPINNTIKYKYELITYNTILNLTVTGYHSVLPEATWYFRLKKKE